MSDNPTTQQEAYDLSSKHLQDVLQLLAQYVRTFRKDEKYEEYVKRLKELNDEFLNR